ncbi:hypothetical protein [Halococcus salsus]|uniref:hypothetical protein n=1 Tax=Halococcus salsus TaxID=2162894 RepID=UPI00135CB359|nr:hypothetical protein [Halococcus salsus]
MSSWSKHGRQILPIFLLAIFAHSKILQNWFVASDTLPLIQTSRVTNLSELVDIFTQPLMGGSDFVTGALFYRPVSSLSYAADYAIWGLNPFGYHLTNLLLHAVAAILVAVMVTTLTSRPKVGSLTAVLFALHPVTTEVVPVTARRQDILLTIFALASITLFVKWYRVVEESGEIRWKRKAHWLLGGALLMYLCALGSKETALMVVGLVTVWVTLQVGVERPRLTIQELAKTTGLFVVVSVPYVALRTSVLGGLGGYDGEAQAVTFQLLMRHLIDVFFFVIKYSLWLTYPLYFIEEQTTTLLENPFLVVFLVVFFVIIGRTGIQEYHRRSSSQRKHLRGMRTLSPIMSIIGFSTIPILLIQKSFSPALSAGASGTIVSYAIGILFVGGCLGVIVTTILVRKGSVSRTKRMQLIFFGCWVIIPVAGLATQGFVTSKPMEYGFGIRNGYFAIVPAMALLSILLVPALRRIWDTAKQVNVDKNRLTRSEVLNSDTVRIASILLLLFPLIAASPALHAQNGWQAAGELNRQSLSGLQTSLENTPNEPFTYVADFPNEFNNQQRAYSRVHSITPLQPYSIEAWLKLHDETSSTQIRLVRKKTVSSVPENLSFRTGDRNGWTAVWVTQTSNETPSMVDDQVVPSQPPLRSPLEDRE